MMEKNLKSGRKQVLERTKQRQKEKKRDKQKNETNICNQ